MRLTKGDHHRLPIEAVESPFQEKLTDPLDMVLGHWLLAQDG